MKIVLIGTVASSLYGFRASLIKALVAQSHEVYAFAVDYDTASWAKVESLGAIPVSYTFARTGINPLSDLINTYKLFRKLKLLAPDIVFSYFVKPVIFGTLAAALAGVKRRIGMLEGLGYIFTSQPIRTTLKIHILRMIQIFLYRITLPLLERIIFLNSDDPLDLIEKNNIHVKMVSVLGGIGVELSQYRFSIAPSFPVSFIFVGRLLAQKGVNEYILAARRVKITHPEVQFFLLGELDEDNPGGLSSQELQKLINERVVVYPGHVGDVQEWLTACSVFVLPSYREGVPRSTQEAMAVGRPIITTDVPGCRDTVINGRNGFLIPPWRVEELTEKMMYFINNPASIEKMGLESYLIAQEKYDAQKVTQRLMGMLECTS